MVKVVVENKENKVDIDFPLLMIAIDGTIILAERRDGIYLSGVVIRPKTNIDKGLYYSHVFKIGEYSGCWIFDSFSPFYGTIILNNELR